MGMGRQSYVGKRGMKTFGEATETVPSDSLHPALFLLAGKGVSRPSILCRSSLSGPTCSKSTFQSPPLSISFETGSSETETEATLLLLVSVQAG